jgi:hypothetical protein
LHLTALITMDMKLLRAGARVVQGCRRL